LQEIYNSKMKRIQIVLSTLTLAFTSYAQNWEALNSGLANGGYITCLFSASLTGDLVAGGRFNMLGGDSIRGIACWDGQNWSQCYSTVDSGISSLPANVWSITRYNGDLIIAGAFTKLGDSLVPFLGKWNGIRWEKIGNVSPNSPILRTFEWNNELYVVGSFDSIGNQAINNIAKWNGTTWSTVANNYVFGTGSRIDGGCVYNGTLFISGFFDDPFGNTCRLAHLNSNSWLFYPSIIAGGLADIYDFAEYNNELYIAGLFYQSSQTPSTSIIRYDGNTWRDVGGGPDYISNPYPTIKDLFVFNNKLHVVGNFESMGGVSCMGYAIWDGNNWCSTGDTFNKFNGYTGASIICDFNDSIHLAGSFSLINSDTIYGIAKWIGGNYVDTCGNTTSISELLIDQELVVFPNPAYDVITVSGLPSANPVQIEVFNIHGQMIFTSATSTATYSLNTNSWSPGLYSIRLISPTTIVHRKVVVAR